MPSASAALATSAPMAPRPTTPSFLPLISPPANELLPFSTSLPTLSPSPLSVLAHSMAGMTFREEISRPAMTSSLTALAFAPGVLNTTMPCSLHLSSGILLTPAPARAIASRLSGSSISCMEAERTMMPSGFSISAPTVKFSGSSRSRPRGEILLSVKTFCMVISPSCVFLQSLS